MTEGANLFDAELSRLELRNRMLTFLEEHRTGITEYLENWWEEESIDPFESFVSYFLNTSLPWFRREEIELLTELSKHQNVHSFMVLWNDLMVCHPDRSDAFYDHYSDDSDGVRELIRRSTAHDLLELQVKELQDIIVGLRLELAAATSPETP